MDVCVGVGVGVGASVGEVYGAGRSKETCGIGSGGDASQECSKTSGRGIGRETGGRGADGRETLLSMRLITEGGAVCDQALICQTDLKLASVRHVENASS